MTSTQTTPRIDLATARRLAAEVVAEFGADFVYRKIDADISLRGCFNVPLPELREKGVWKHAPVDSDPRESTGCLVAVILDRAGFTVHREAGVNRSGIRTIAHTFPDLFVPETGDEALDDRLVVRFLGSLQNIQDGGSTWGRAVEIAEEYLVDDIEARNRQNDAEEVG